MLKRLLAGIKILFLFVVPAAVLILSFLAKNSRTPYWGNPDPTYQYLFCSLHILNGITPSHTDHPGTTVQMLGALVLKLMHPFSSGQDIAGFVIDDPEGHLYAMNSFFVICHVLTVFLLGWYAYKKSNDLFMAVLLQAVPALRFLGSVYEMTFMQPEIFHYTVLNMYVSCLVKLYYDKSKMDFYWTAVLSGFACGIGVATKVTMIPLFFAPLILLPRWKTKLVFAVSSLAFFILATLPIISVYGRMLDWLYKIAFKSSPSMHGAPQPFVVGKEFLGNLTAIIPANDVIFQWIGCGLVVLFARYLFILVLQRKEQMPQINKAAYFIFAVLLVMMLQISMVAKYPARHYLIPTYGLTGALLFFVFELFGSSKLRSVAIIVFLMVFVVPEAGSRGRSYQAVAEESRKVLREKLAFHENVEHKYSQCYFVYASGCSHLLWALNWGDHWHTYMKFGDILKEKYPYALFYDLWEREIHDFSQKGPVEEVYSLLRRKSDCILLQAGCSNYGHFARVMDLELKEKQDAECIYKVKGMQDPRYW